MEKSDGNAYLALAVALATWYNEEKIRRQIGIYEQEVLIDQVEEILRCLLECDSRRDSHVNFSDDIFPSYVQMSVGVELEKLIQYGMIGGLLSFDNGGMLDLLPPAFSYFEDKQAALDRQDKREKERQQSIINYGNLVFGNVSGSTLTVDNSIHQIEQAIDEKGGEDKEELHELLEGRREALFKTPMKITRNEL